jgi:hypothetical protein
MGSDALGKLFEEILKGKNQNDGSPICEEICVLGLGFASSFGVVDVGDPIPDPGDGAILGFGLSWI